MTYQEWTIRSVDRLTKAGCDSPAFEVRCICEDLACRHPRMTDEIPPAVVERLERAVDERAARRPLQYILGNWDFLHLNLKVGEGVLIPRPDTEILCETAADFLRKTGAVRPRVLDLCAGSGCVGLGVASLYDGVAVTAVERSPEALAFLRQNVAESGLAADVVEGDVLVAPPADLGRFDVIVSNPPYIPTADLPYLMPEVQCEPRMALDGGADGLMFYRAIMAHWLPLLKDGGLLAVEIGQGQEQDVAALFAAAGLQNVTATPDLSGILRVVSGQKEGF